MKKLKILAIAPYDGLLRLIQETVAKNDNLEIHTYVANLEQGAQLVRDLQKEGFDAIISRGGTAELIEKVAAVPVVELPVSAYDMLRVIQLSQNYAEKLAIVGYPAIINCAKSICDLMQYRVQMITIHDPTELNVALNQLHAQGCGLIIGDTVTTTSAKNAGFNTILITSGRESIYTAFEQAVKICRAFHSEKKQRVLAENVLAGAGLHAAAYSQTGTCIYTSLTPEQENALSPLIQRNLESLWKKKNLHLVKTLQQTLWSVEATVVESEGAPYAVFYVTSRTMPAVVENKGIHFRNSTEGHPTLFDTFYDSSESMKELVNAARHYSETLLPVLIFGEDGTGKDTFASAIYENSALRGHPFLTIESSSMNTKNWNYLFESDRSPLIDSQYTIYFRAVNRLTPELQARLQSYIMSTSVQKRNRLIFSYTLPLRESDLRFCSYLQNELACLTLTLPPLRERKEGIPSLAILCLSHLNETNSKQVVGFEPQAMELLQGFYWPYNINQFKRIIEQLFVLTDGAYVHADTVAAMLKNEEHSVHQEFGSHPFDLSGDLEGITRRIIETVLKQENMNQTRAAQRLGISRSTMWRKLSQTLE